MDGILVLMRDNDNLIGCNRAPRAMADSRWESPHCQRWEEERSGKLQGDSHQNKTWQNSRAEYREIDL